MFLINIVTKKCTLLATAKFTSFSFLLKNEDLYFREHTEDT